MKGIAAFMFSDLFFVAKVKDRDRLITMINIIDNDKINE